MISTEEKYRRVVAALLARLGGSVTLSFHDIYGRSGRAEIEFIHLPEGRDVELRLHDPDAPIEVTVTDVTGKKIDAVLMLPDHGQ